MIVRICNELRVKARQFWDLEKHQNFKRFDVSSGYCRSRQAGACVSATRPTSALQPPGQRPGFRFARESKHILLHIPYCVGTVCKGVRNNKRGRSRQMNDSYVTLSNALRKFRIFWSVKMLMKATMYGDLESYWQTWPTSKFRARIGFHINFCELRDFLSFPMYLSRPTMQFYDMYIFY